MKNKIWACLLALVSALMIPMSMHMLDMDVQMKSGWAFVDALGFIMAFIGFGEAYWIYTKEQK